MKTYRTVVGIDPGAKGSIAVVSHELPGDDRWSVTSINGWNIWLMRLKDINYDMSSLEFPDSTSLYIESQHPFPRQGVSSTGKFMKHYGFLLGQATMMFKHIVEVYPSVWKRHYAILGEPKQASRDIVRKYFVDRKLSIDDSEAILIACYGFQLENGLNVLT